MSTPSGRSAIGWVSNPAASSASARLATQEAFAQLRSPPFGSQPTLRQTNYRYQRRPKPWLGCSSLPQNAKRLGRSKMPTLERGFKAWAERTATSVRRELELSPTQILDPYRFAEFLGVRLINPRDDLVGLEPNVLTQLLEEDPWGWSAATLQVADKMIVIFNPRKSRGRQTSDIVHELAHIMLGHEPAQVIFSEDGQIATRTFDRKQEDEANWLGWAILLPREALVAARRSRMLNAQIAEAYGVTERLVGYRIQMTGVDQQMRRRRKIRGA